MSSLDTVWPTAINYHHLVWSNSQGFLLAGEQPLPVRPHYDRFLQHSGQKWKLERVNGILRVRKIILLNDNTTTIQDIMSLHCNPNEQPARLAQRSTDGYFVM